jgi:aspartyl-tRNA(Asn)/glutamyl-tRNA(Gln) amidotransferase subunit C
MSIGREQVLHVAKLAEIGVDEADLPKLVEQLDRIVGYVEQLNQVPEAPAEPFLAGPTAAPLRDDVVRPVPLERPPVDFAPEFRDGFFLVPRHGAMEDL